MRLLLLFVAGCYNPTPSAGAPCGPDESCPSGLTCQAGFCGGPIGTTDGPADAPNIFPDGCTTFASQLDTCTVTPGGTLDLNGDYVYDTITHQLTKAGSVVVTTHALITGAAGPIDVLVVNSLNFTTGTLRVVGGPPFGIVAFDSISINGLIDASAGGAGSRATDVCTTTGGGKGTTNAPGSSGGGGGAFRGAGGLGGVGDANGAAKPGAAGGIPVALPAGPLGGCPGGDGGGGTSVGGPGGAGGGAVYLVARSMISVNGTIDLGGAGAHRGDPLGGAGGGGGSGGMIVIEAPTVTINGQLEANGGGGGGGAGAVAGATGSNGQAGQVSLVAALGGDGAPLNEGGNGGKGGAGNSINGAASISAPDHGGGGGGGGCGFIAIGATSLSTDQSLITPALSAWPVPPH